MPPEEATARPSVKITRNAKGERAYEVKAYADTLPEAQAAAIKSSEELENTGKFGPKQ